MSIAADLANRTLEREGWMRERLAAHSGRNLRIAIGPMAITLSIDDAGLVASTRMAPDLTLTVSPLRLPTLLASPERWSELVGAEGDAALAGTLAELAQTLPWFVEREFARWLGPILGQRVADAGRELLRLPDYAAGRFGDSVAAFARDEANFGVRASDLRAFAADVAALSARVDALWARSDALGDAVKPRDQP
jgi:ubiquinone biosynthesis protein UbiJ